MHTPRIYQEEELEVGQSITLDRNAANHVSRVLRMKRGDQLILFNGRGGEYNATLEKVDRNATCAHIDTYSSRITESPLSITLLQGISRGERMDYTIQKAVELGVAEIIPLFTERCTVQLKDDRVIKKLHHWRGVAISACEQSGRTRIPAIRTPLSLQQYLQEHPTTGTALLLDPGATQGFTSLAHPDSRVTLLIGPEGGLSHGEIEHARQAGFLGVRLGPRILRTETAALVACTALQTLWGDYR